MSKIELRPQRISDAKRFYEILNNPNFIYFDVRPKSIEAEIKFLKESREKRKKKSVFNYSIIYNGKLVGGCGIKIDQHRKYIGEIGYFIEEEHWGKGITTKAVKKLEKIGFKELGLKRIQALMLIGNKASEKVAIKCGYKKEGIMRKAIEHEKKLCDCYLYSKVK